MALIESLTGIGGSAVEELVAHSSKTPLNELKSIDLTALMLKKWRNSDIIKDMITANEYYFVRNTAIAEKKREYKDQHGRVYENETLSNAKIASGFLRASVNQKVNYGFGKPFIISVEKILNDSGEETADNNKDKNKDIYITEWQNFFDTNRRQAVKHIVKNAINNGRGWAYIWINDGGQLQLIDVDSETIYPKWQDKSRKVLEYLIRDYIKEEIDLTENEFINVKKVEYWNAEAFERFIDKSKGGGLPDLIIDVDGENMQDQANATAHMIYQGQPITWGRIPFISLKGNDDELPLLNVIKEAVDAYDALTSKSIDSLQDDLDPVLVVEGVTADVEMLKITRKTMQEYRIITLDKDHKAYYVQVKADISASQQKLEHLRKDIREWSVTVDTQDVKFGSNPSGVALKAMYQDLDIYMDGLELEFEVFIENLKYFFDRWLQFKGVGTVELWEQYRVIVILNRDMLINQADDVKMLMNLAATNPDFIVPIETLDNINPFAESYEIEESRRKAESLKKQQNEANGKNNDMAGFIMQARNQVQNQEEDSENE